MTHQVITANRLDDGLTVYYDAAGQWQNQIAKAAIYAEAEAADKALAEASSAENELHVVGPYLIDVTTDNGGITPTRLREVIRMQGPSVRPDLGYQADQA